jgi:hypothetical protein
LNVNGPPLIVRVGVNGAVVTVRVTYTLRGDPNAPGAETAIVPLYVLAARPVGFTVTVKTEADVDSVPLVGLIWSHEALDDAEKAPVPALRDALNVRAVGVPEPI